YWLEAFDPYKSLEKLRQTPLEIARMLTAKDEDILTRPPADGGWTIRNILAHLLDAQGVLNFRVNLMLTQENPELKSLAVFDWAINDQDRPTSTQEILATYRDSRQETLLRLESIPLADWWQTGLHQEFGSVTIRQQVSYFAMHEISHLPSIVRQLRII
ncbi:MAG: DinB family protein, partial [Anaerolineales bacterium]